MYIVSDVEVPYPGERRGKKKTKYQKPTREECSVFSSQEEKLPNNTSLKGCVQTLPICGYYQQAA
jgi:hypothetical protein